MSRHTIHILKDDEARIGPLGSIVTAFAICGAEIPHNVEAVSARHAGLTTCADCRKLSALGVTSPPAAGAEQLIHLTLNQGYSIACRPNEGRSMIEPRPHIVELADHELITCPDCKLDAAAELGRRAKSQEEAPSSAVALKRIAEALERIASVLEDPRPQVDQVIAALARCGIGS